MKANNKQILRLMLIVSVLLLGCGGGQLLIPTLTPTLTSTLTLTIPPTSTSTPVPTSTPTPTAIPPASASNYLVNPVIDHVDTFESPSEQWDLVAGNIADGVLTIAGNGNWNSITLDRQFTEGQGIIMMYKLEKAREWSLVFTNGAAWGPEYLQLGIIDLGYPMTSIFKGENPASVANLRGNFQPKLDTWYQIMMAVGKDANFLVVISDPSDPTRSIVYKERLSEYQESWVGISWTLQILVNQGILTIDDFMVVSFSDIK